MKRLVKYVVFSLIIAQPLSVKAQDLSVFANVLYWEASQETASIWSSDIQVPANEAEVIFSPQNIDFDWKAGFRGGVFYESESNCVDAKLYWTYFQTQGNMNHSVGAQILAPQFFSGFLSNNFFFGAGIDWQLVMNMIDFEISHEFKISPSLFIRPLIGIKGGTINQTIHSRWDAVIFTSTEVVENDFRGIGPSFGIDGKWAICKGLDLVGDFSAAFLWGRWDVRDTYSRPSALFGLVTPTTIISEMGDSQLGAPMLRYFVGLEWTYQTAEKIPRFTVQLGYEMQYWANQLRLLTFQQLPLHGDLTLQGATCGVSIDF